jgi:hypothetical protein|tara:strand:+ start:3149 stop:3442 length:294 start_codon:yes stop_codon:yes gene_type:complete
VYGITNNSPIFVPMNKNIEDIELYANRAKECLQGDEPDLLRAIGYINAIRDENKKLKESLRPRLSSFKSSAYEFPKDAERQLSIDNIPNIKYIERKA